MTSVLNIESIIYSKLKNELGIGVFNHIPDDAELPLLRIGQIEYDQWLIAPPTMKATFELNIFSEANSNKEVIELVDKTIEVLLTIPNTYISGRSIRQFKDGLWSGELSITFTQLQ